MPILNTDEEKKKKGFKDLLEEQSGLIYNAGGIKPFGAGNVGSPVSEEEAGAIRGTFPNPEPTETVVNYPFGKGRNEEAMANTASQYRPQDNLVSTIKSNVPPVEVLENQPAPTTGRRDIFGQPWKEQPKYIDVKDYVERYGPAFPGGTTRMDATQRAKAESGYYKGRRMAAEHATTINQLLSSGVMAGESREEVGQVRAEATTEAARLRAETTGQTQEMLNAYRESSLALKEKGLESKERMNEAILNLREKALAYAKDNKDKLTMTDVKTGFNMALSDIKNRIMVDATPEDQSMLANQPPENLAALLLSGKVGRTLKPEKKTMYINELKKTTEFYRTLEQQVMGRKGAKLPLEEKKSTRPRPVF